MKGTKLWLSVAVLLAGALLTVQARRWVAAERGLQTAQRRLVDVGHDTAEVQRLSALEEASSFGPPPVQDLIERVGEELRSAGLPARTLANLTNEADRAAGRTDEGLRRRDARLTLEPIAPEELGAFLAGWRSHHPLWTVSEIELSRLQGRGQEGSGYSARLVLSALYVDPATDRP